MEPSAFGVWNLELGTFPNSVKYPGMNDRSEPKPKYTWPWFVLALVVLGVVLFVVWVSAEARRLHRQRDPYSVSPPALTNSIPK